MGITTPHLIVLPIVGLQTPIPPPFGKHRNLSHYASPKLTTLPIVMLNKQDTFPQKREARYKRWAFTMDGLEKFLSVIVPVLKG